MVSTVTSPEALLNTARELAHRIAYHTEAVTAMFERREPNFTGH
jgi:hypothetical protein